MPKCRLPDADFHVRCGACLPAHAILAAPKSRHAADIMPSRDSFDAEAAYCLLRCRFAAAMHAMFSAAMLPPPI